LGFRDARPGVIESGRLSDVEPDEGDRSEVDGPDVWGDFLESDVLAVEQMPDADPA